MSSDNTQQSGDVQDISRSEWKIFHERRQSTRPESNGESIPKEQFQIVWRELCFEVTLTTFKQQVRDILKRVTERWSKDEYVNSKYQLNPISSDSEAKSNSTKNMDGERRMIFDNLNGAIRSGEITAILGPSGVGKTSLLNAICGFDTNNYRGSIQLIGGRHKKRMQLSLIPQKDYLVETLTVHDNLLFSSRILNDIEGFDHEANIARVAKVLNLVECLATECKNLSGGEYKRVSIAQELLHEPDILVLDEPTSGLDSLNCKQLIKTLKDLIEASNLGVISPIAIVMTIHQPDIEIYSMFDHVYCLAPGGKVIFDGHPNDTKDVLQTEGGLNINFSQLINPANLLIEVASSVDGRGRSAIDRLASYQQEQFLHHFRSLGADQNRGIGGESRSGGDECSNEVARFLKVDAQISGSHLDLDKRLEPSRSRHKGLFWYHTCLLTKRAFTSTVRDPKIGLMSLIFHLTFPLVVWAVFSPKIGRVTGCPELVREMSFLSVAIDETHNRLENMIEDMRITYEGVTMFFLVTYSLSLCCLETASLTFPLHMHILLKEVRNGWYAVPTFILGKTIANFPFEVLFPVTSLILCYFLLEMPSSYLQWRLILMALVMAVTAMVSTTQGLVFGAICMDDAQAAVFMATAYTLPQMLLSGFLARVKNMPKLLRHLGWLSQYRYSYNLNTIFTYGYGRCQCDPETEKFLQTTEPKIIDVPKRMRSVYKLYLDKPSGIFNNGTVNSTSIAQQQLKHIPGMNYDLILNSTVESRILEQIKSDQLDLFEEMPKLVSRLFSYGHTTDNCQSVRSIVLDDLPPDEWAPLIFCSFIGFLVVWKLILYFVVWVKTGSRI